MLTGCLVAGLLPFPAWSDSEQDKAREEFRAGRIQSFGQIKSAVERRFDGRVLDAELRSGGKIYHLKILTSEGDVIIVRADARSGRVLSVEGGR